MPAEGAGLADRKMTPGSEWVPSVPWGRPPAPPRRARARCPASKRAPSLLPEASEEGFQIPATITERYKVGRTIGDGNFAVVKECVER